MFCFPKWLEPLRSNHVRGKQATWVCFQSGNPQNGLVVRSSQLGKGAKQRCGRGGQAFDEPRVSQPDSSFQEPWLNSSARVNLCWALLHPVWGLEAVGMAERPRISAAIGSTHRIADLCAQRAQDSVHVGLGLFLFHVFIKCCVFGGCNNETICCCPT